MREALGMFMVFLAILLGCVLLFGMEFSLREKIATILGGGTFIALLIFGVYLLVE